MKSIVVFLLRYELPSSTAHRNKSAIIGQLLRAVEKGFQNRVPFYRKFLEIIEKICLHEKLFRSSFYGFVCNTVTRSGGLG